VKYLFETRAKMAENPETFAERDPFLFTLLTKPNIKESELIVLITELYQGGIDAVSQL
jgi:hypothetical protein